jgi:transcriptional regulator with XRE-family HTH domain
MEKWRYTEGVLKKRAERRTMSKIKLSLRAIRIQMGKTREEMAELMGMGFDRYSRIENGTSPMKAGEFIKLHDVSGVPFENIEPGD